MDEKYLPRLDRFKLAKSRFVIEKGHGWFRAKCLGKESFQRPLKGMLLKTRSYLPCQPI